MCNILKEYLNHHNKYTKIYGDKTIVLMEVGSFFEAYGIVNNEESVGKVYEISQDTGLTLTRKNKKIAENNRKNPLMTGFNNIILENEYVTQSIYNMESTDLDNFLFSI